MRKILLLTFILLGFSPSPLVLATDTPKPPPTEEELRQQWDTECRALMPAGQGDLEGALLYKLRECIVEKKRLYDTAAKRAYELQRLSDRSEREAFRRQTILSRVRGFQTIIDRMKERMIAQQGAEKSLPTLRRGRRYLYLSDTPNTTASD
jgi:hypothetical protein